MVWDQAVPSKQAEAGQRRSSPAVNRFRASNALPYGCWGRRLGSQLLEWESWLLHPPAVPQFPHLYSENNTSPQPTRASQGDTVVKNLPANAGDPHSIPGLGRSPGEGNGYPLPLQYSCLGNPLDRGAWRTAAHGVARSWTWLSE